MSSEEKCQEGLLALKEGICEYLRQRSGGVRHATLVHDLHLESEFEGGHRNYLSWSILGLLMKEGIVKSTGRGRHRRFSLVS